MGIVGQNLQKSWACVALKAFDNCMSRPW